MLKIPEITTDLVRMRLGRVLRQHVGRGLAYENDHDAARRIDVDSRTFESWRKGDRAPQVEGLLRLFLLPEAGAEIAAEMLALVGMQPQTLPMGDPCPFHINAELAGALQKLAGMLADGRIDHTEDPEWQAEALDVACKLIAHVNARRAAKARAA